MIEGIGVATLLPAYRQLGQLDPLEYDITVQFVLDGQPDRTVQLPLDDVLRVDSIAYTHRTSRTAARHKLLVRDFRTSC